LLTKYVCLVFLFSQIKNVRVLAAANRPKSKGSKERKAHGLEGSDDLKRGRGRGEREKDREGRGKEKGKKIERGEGERERKGKR
jgi:hypothetical protein